MMTEQEAIKAIEHDLEWHNKELQPKYKKVLRFAIKALEEIQEYRAIGTVEELKSLQGDYWKVNEICKMYSEIGTVKEFKALKEKSEPKKADGIENVIPYGTKIIYHGQNGWKDCKCYCGHYNKENGTYNIFRGWNLTHVQKENIEVFNWE